MSPRRRHFRAMDVLFTDAPVLLLTGGRLHRRPDRPAAGQEFARRLGEPAAERPESLERDPNLGTGSMKSSRSRPVQSGMVPKPITVPA
jgi:hypothetical protein